RSARAQARRRQDPRRTPCFAPGVWQSRARVQPRAAAPASDDRTPLGPCGRTAAHRASGQRAVFRGTGRAALERRITDAPLYAAPRGPGSGATQAGSETATQAATQGRGAAETGGRGCAADAGTGGGDGRKARRPVARRAFRAATARRRRRRTSVEATRVARLRAEHHGIRLSRAETLVTRGGPHAAWHAGRFGRVQMEGERAARCRS